MITAISILAATALSLISISILKLLKIRKLKNNNTNITAKYKKQRKLYYHLLSAGITLLLIAMIIDLSMRL